MRSADRIAGAALLALAVAFSAGALKHYSYWGENGPGSAFLPFWLGVVMAVLAAMLLVGALRSDDPGAAVAAARRRTAPARARPRRDHRVRRLAERRRHDDRHGAVPRRPDALPRSPAVAADDRRRARRRRIELPRLRALAACAVAHRPVRLLSAAMDFLANLSLGFSVALTPFNLLMATCGVVIGILIGALPGIGPPSGVALLLPLTFGMDPTSGIIMLAALYAGTMYGGTITSVLINTPGESASVVTCIDGHQMALQGRAGAGARHRRDRLVHRRDDRRRPADAGLAGAGALVARLRPARDLRAAAARPDDRHPAHRRERAQGLHQHGARADDRDGRLRRHLGRSALRVRRARADGRDRLPAGRDRPVRHRRGPRWRRGRGRRGDPLRALRLARRHADRAGLAAQPLGDRARHRARLSRRHPAGRRADGLDLSFVCGREEGLEASGGVRHAARSRASPDPSRPTTRPPPARWCRC